jgi:rubrerythrin
MEATIANLINLAIQSEEAAERLYKRLAELFAAEPEVEAFWLKYAQDESGHANWLRKLPERSTATQLNAPADPEIWKAAQKAATAPVEKYLQAITTLEDAYTLAVDLENSETNVVFDFLVAEYATDKQTLPFLRQQMQQHIQRLQDEFPLAYRSRVRRLATKARP